MMTRFRSPAILSILALALVISIIPAFTRAGAPHVLAQISPLSPLNAIDSSGPILSLTGAAFVNVMASGQVRLLGLALLLLAIIAGASVLIWRQP